MDNRGLLGFIFGPIIKWIVLGVGAVFVIAWIVTLANVKTSDLTVTGVSDVGLSGLDLSATLTIENGGLLPVQIENIPYTVTLDETNATVASGMITGFTLPPKESKAIPLDIEVSWTGAGMTALELVRADSIPATIEAQVRLQPIYIITVPVSVRQTVDLANYTTDRTGIGILDVARETFENSGLGDKIDEILN